jgi:hypothetical protein
VLLRFTDDLCPESATLTARSPPLLRLFQCQPMYTETSN